MIVLLLAVAILAVAIAILVLNRNAAMLLAITAAILSGVVVVLSLLGNANL